MFDLESVTLKNFCSFRGEHRFVFPSAPGLYSITGQNLSEPNLSTNNCGKTTLLESIIWCLYGRTSRGLKATDIITWGEKSCEVSIEIILGGQKHTVCRKQAPNSRTFDGIEITQEALDSWLRIGFDQFCYSVMFPQFGNAFFDLGATDKLNLFSQIMNLDFWLDKSEEATEIAKETDKQLQDTRLKIAGLEGQEKALQASLAELEVKHAFYEAEQRAKLKEAKAKAKAIAKELEEQNKTLAQYKAALLSLDEKIKNTKQVCHECGQPLVTDDLKSLRRNREDHEKALAHLERANCRLEEEYRRCSVEHSISGTNVYSGLLKNERKRLDTCISLLRQNRDDEATVLQDHKAVAYWATAFKRVRLFVCEHALSQLDIEINNNLASLGLPDWAVKLDIERETKAGGITRGFTVLIYAPNRAEPVRWEAFSGGATQRLRLAGNLGLANLIMERAGYDNRIEFYDEFSQHMSQEGINDTLETLSARARDLGRRIFVIDHHSLDFGDFAGVIRVVKTDKGSEIHG